MNNTAALLLVLCVGIAGGWLLHNNGASDRNCQPTSCPSIEQIQQLASLAVLRVPVADVKIYQMEGYTGGIEAILVVKGDVEIATDLSAGRFETIDPEQRHAVLLLTIPAPRRPRVDHEHTQLYRIDRSGLWVLPGGGAETDLVNRAMSHAQRLVGKAGTTPAILDQARERTTDVITKFFGAIGWTVDIRWQQTTVTASQPAGKSATGA